MLYICSYTFGFCKWHRYKRISKTYACEKILHCSPSTDKGFHTKGEAVVRCDNGLPFSSF